MHFVNSESHYEIARVIEDIYNEIFSRTLILNHLYVYFYFDQELLFFDSLVD